MISFVLNGDHIFIAIVVVGLVIGIVNVSREPHLPPGMYPTVNNRRARRRRR